jgi:glyoxylase-like metal-dependent hydrolase (beta-lactamase superfamily II)
MSPSCEFGPVRIYAGEKNGKYPDGNQVIVEGAGCRAVFDSPLVSNHIGADFDDADLVIQGHMHEDHVAGLHRLPAAEVHIHESDLPAMQSWEGLKQAYGYADEVSRQLLETITDTFHYLPRPDAIGFGDGHSWDLGGGVSVHALHTPGHTAGHCVLLVEPVGVLCTGDIDLSGFGPYYGDRTSDMVDFRRSLEKLADIPATTWVTFHHRGVYTSRKQFLEDLAAYASKIDSRSDRLLALLAERPQSLAELAAQGLLYDPGKAPPWAADAERYTIVQHLEELSAQGLVVQGDDNLYGLA